jgi:hypothetical protein
VAPQCLPLIRSTEAAVLAHTPEKRTPVCGGASVPPGRHPVAGAHTVHVHSIRKDIQPIHKAS